MRLLHEIPTLSSRTPRPEFPQLLDGRQGRLVAATPDRTALIVSTQGCDAFRTVPVALPWFVQGDTVARDAPFAGPVPYVIFGVRWYSEDVVAILIQRPNPNARYSTADQGRFSPVPPKGMPPLSETVLLAVRVRDGAVLGEAVLDRAGWSFVSGRELIKRRIDEAGDTMDLWSFRLEVDRAAPDS
jgi:hypothetical protein